MPAIDKLLVLVEHVEVGSAGSAIRVGHVLRFVEEIRERVPGFLCFPDHALGSVVGKRNRVVRIDRNDCQSAFLELGDKSRELATNVPDERTVMADESHEERTRCVRVRRHDLAG